VTTAPNDSPPIPPKDFLTNLGTGSKAHRHVIGWIITAVVFILLAGLALFWFADGNSQSIRYKTSEVKQGDLTVTVTATGTLEPVNQVDVGSEISGTIKQVNVDFNDHVTQGQVLAVLDTDQLQARVNQAKASLELAKAKVAEAMATVQENKQKNQRQLALEAKGLCSQEDCDAAKAAYERAQAGLASAKAQVVQAQASLDAEKTTLRKATIHSPINGIVLKRNVEPGQTVAASLQTPVLFTLAENLTQMELQVDVDEADVGQVEKGQDAIFTVDAYPNKQFPAKITEVHLAPKTVEGVVTYETVLRVDNSELFLRPGMTATADITVKKMQNVLLVPNAALRFTPPAKEDQTSSESGSLISKLMPHPPRRPAKQNHGSANSKQQKVWTLSEGKLVAIPVTVGATDGSFTEVVAGDIKAGMSVVIDTVSTGG
jgi:HlyD family secretion protein